jgi:hypothetical protein
MGIEPTPRSAEDSTNPARGGAESGALTPYSAALDPGLSALVDAWSTLPEPIRAGILALVEAAKS